MLVNGAIIWFLSGDHPDTLYGDDVHAAVIDEASRCRESAWHAVRTTLTATRGPIRLIGNVKGKKNWFYRLCRRAEGGAPNMHYSRITALDAIAAGVLSKTEVDAARADLPDDIFQQLYMADAADDEGNPFGVDAIRECIGPLSNEEVVCWGVDLAKSVDWTVAIGLAESGAVARIERWQDSWERTIDRLIDLIGDTWAYVDSTGVGDPIVEWLQAELGSTCHGYNFGSQGGRAKQQLMELLAVVIQREEMQFPPGVIVNELEAFEYSFSRTGVTYSAPEGLHDDAVCALALAAMCRERMPPILRFY